MEAQGVLGLMKPGVYAKEFRSQAGSFKALSRLMRAGEPDSKQLVDAAVAMGLSEVCELMADRVEAEEEK